MKALVACLLFFFFFWYCSRRRHLTINNYSIIGHNSQVIFYSPECPYYGIDYISKVEIQPKILWAYKSNGLCWTWILHPFGVLSKASKEGAYRTVFDLRLDIRVDTSWHRLISSSQRICTKTLVILGNKRGRYPEIVKITMRNRSGNIGGKQRERG